MLSNAVLLAVPSPGYMLEDKLPGVHAEYSDEQAFALIAEKETLYIPTDATTDIAQFKKWNAGMKMSEKLKTSRSAKDFFFPQTEALVNFKIEGKKIDIIDPREECEDFVIFGVRACDAKSFEILDRVFLVYPVDTYYKNRREHGTIVTLACSRPSESSTTSWICTSRRFRLSSRI